MNRARSKLQPAVALFGVMVFAGSAHASPSYAPWLMTQFGAPVLPPCTTCHLSAAGGSGTTEGIPYAETLKEAGLVANLTQDQFLAIVVPGSNGDSDQDSFSDAQEIATEGNPNDPSVGPGGAAVEPYEYGCIGSKDEPAGDMMTSATTSSIAGVHAKRPWALWLMFAAALMIARRRSVG